MKKSIWSGVVLALALASMPLMGCSVEAADAGEEQSTGSVSMALSSVTNGTEYRLTNATFEIDGAVSTVLGSDDSQAVISAVLPVGGYTAFLQSGWMLQRNDGGVFVNVAASLVSPNPTNFMIGEGSNTSLVYQFDTDGTIISIGSGQLEISIAVNEIGSPGGCTAFEPECGPEAWCVPGSIIGVPENQCLPAGPLNVGEPCDGGELCGMNALCGDIGFGPQCLEVCSPSHFGQPCEFGGGICMDINFPDIGLCQ